MDWNKFAASKNFDEVVFQLASQSIDLILGSDLDVKDFQAFAFNCSSYSGDISLSIGVNPGYEDKRNRNRLYPPDWEYESIESEINEINALLEKYYFPIQLEYQKIIEELDDIDDFSSGFLNSLRVVMVRLERQGLIQKLSKKPVWTLVTEIDADTREEEQLLEKVRKIYA